MKKCIECGQNADAQPQYQSENYPICASCFNKGWTSDPKEIAQALKKDSLFAEQQIIHELKEIIFGNARKGALSDELEHGQILGFRTGKGLEFDNLAKGLFEYIRDNFLTHQLTKNNK